ncbi:putative lipoate-protein ligase A [Cyphellophora attinorum]|uniref:Putative lipoate-protein ligase A n=1 Tax=Cyphellophora attinorum TaxID=1664694 RepID=A0A0N0NQV1_9EURO|nr:putative lipoate-protein ligase A [Phialophora attinorum]KPI44099.1 putative lipoate-protein ligase A [Phialophora attinorum]
MDALSKLQATPAEDNGNGSFVFVSTSSDPYFNLSVEHYLLTHSDHTSRILFLYANRPCVVFGRNQNPWVECNLPAIMEGLPPVVGDGKDTSAARVPIEIVRRRSGGGTVFHGEGNLNYCAIVPNDKSFSRHTHAEMVVRALRSVQKRRPGAADQEVEVNERHDIVMRRADDSNKRWLKVSGSAYKLLRGRALHHGTLLLDSPYLERISGLLKGMGKDLITMKGVGSVRSPVANLFPSALGGRRKGSSAERDSSGATADRHGGADSRAELREEVQEAIIAEWNALHSIASAAATDTRGFHPTSSIISDDGVWEGDLTGSTARPTSMPGKDGTKSPLATIRDGIAELRSLNWKYGQTPRFTFASSQEEEDAPIRLLLEVNRGLIEKAMFESGGHLLPLDLDRSPGVQKRIWEIDSWSKWLEGLREPESGDSHDGAHGSVTREVIAGALKDESIVDRLEECFPCRPGLVEDELPTR